MNMDDSRICKKIFLWDYSICANNWCSEIKGIINKLGLIAKFYNLECCDIGTCKLLLHDISARDWSEKTVTVPKLRTYITFTTSYTVDNTFLLI